LTAGLESPRVASLYRTAPLSALPQADFLNTAVVGSTRADPRSWLAVARRLEHDAGRRRPEAPGPPGPRALDVDLVFWGDLVSHDPDLVLPHPRARERRFVLAPLAEIAPGQPLPPDGETIAALLSDLLAGGGGAQAVERVAGPGWER
jgi:2-amino-4-hydroxy-6-hydroxymethyldihydropteridine diphosphokinase